MISRHNFSVVLLTNNGDLDGCLKEKYIAYNNNKRHYFRVVIFTQGLLKKLS